MARVKPSLASRGGEPTTPRGEEGGGGGPVPPLPPPRSNAKRPPSSLPSHLLAPGIATPAAPPPSKRRKAASGASGGAKGGAHRSGKGGQPSPLPEPVVPSPRRGGGKPRKPRAPGGRQAGGQTRPPHWWRLANRLLRCAGLGIWAPRRSLFPKNLCSRARLSFASSPSPSTLSMRSRAGRCPRASTRRLTASSPSRGPATVRAVGETRRLLFPPRGPQWSVWHMCGKAGGPSAPHHPYLLG